MNRLIIALLLISGLAYGQKMDNGVFVDGEGRIDYNNSTTNLLGISASFTGTATDVSSYSAIAIVAYSDVASETNGLQVQFSAEGADWHNGEDYTIIAGATKFYTPPVQAKYYRLVYINDGAPQGDFHLHAMLKKYPIKWSSHNVNDPIVAEDDATLTKTVLTAMNPSNVFVNVNASKSGNLLTTDAENGLAISKDEVIGTTFIHKFGEAPSFAQANGYVTVWEGASSVTIGAYQYTYSATNNIDSIISTSTGDLVNVEIQGLDINWVQTNQTVTLNGQTRVAIPTTLRRIFRLKNVGSADLDGIVSCYVTNSATTAGVVNVPADVRAVIDDGNNQTLMAVYTVPAGKTGYMRDWYASTAGANKTSNYDVHLRARPFGQVFQLKHTGAVSETGTSTYQHRYVEPEVFTEKTDIEISVRATENVTGCKVAAGFDIVLVDN